MPGTQKDHILDSGATEVLLTNAPPDCIEKAWKASTFGSRRGCSAAFTALRLPLPRGLLPELGAPFSLDSMEDWQVHSLIIDTLQAIFQQWPAFLMSLQREVVHAISAHLDVQGEAFAHSMGRPTRNSKQFKSGCLRALSRSFAGTPPLLDHW